MATIPTLPLFTSGIAKSGQFNRLRDAIAFWQNPPAAMIAGNAGQSLTSGAWALVAFPTTSYDTDSMVTSTSRITIKTAGRYSIAAKVTIAANATGIRRIMVRKNAGGSSTGGTELYVETTGAIGAAGVKTPVSIPSGPEFQLAVNDTLEVFAYQDSGGALTIDTPVGSVFFAVRLAQVAATTSGDEGTTLPAALTQTLLSTEDLDTITTPGNYLQDANVDATLARHYPTTRAGHLEVHGGANGSFIMQRYTIYGQVPTDVWVRTKYISTWSAWLKLNASGGEGLSFIPPVGWYFSSPLLYNGTTNKPSGFCAPCRFPGYGGAVSVNEVSVNVDTADAAGGAVTVTIKAAGADGLATSTVLSTTVHATTTVGRVAVASSFTIPPEGAWAYISTFTGTSRLRVANSMMLAANAGSGSGPGLTLGTLNDDVNNPSGNPTIVLLHRSA